MRSHSIVLAVSLLAFPLSLLGLPDSGASAAGAPPPDQKVSNTINGHVLLPAPVPNGLEDGVSPVDRVAEPGTHSFDAGPINGTPFSDTPSGTLSDGGTQIDRGDRTFTPADAPDATPNLGR